MMPVIRCIFCGIAAIQIGLLFAGCNPSAQDLERQRINTERQEEHRRIELLDKINKEDVVPAYDLRNETILKLGGKWFVGPSKYFSNGINGAAFYWPSKTPARPESINFPEKKAVTSGEADKVTIYIFMRSLLIDKINTESRYQSILRAENEGRVTNRVRLHEGLEMWRIEDEVKGLRPANWYVAINYKDDNNEPPVLACDDAAQKVGRCTMAFIWESSISVDLRFDARHGQDWPEIYQEVVRVLKLIRRVKS
jgi:hypothetical protein